MATFVTMLTVFLTVHIALVLAAVLHYVSIGVFNVKRYGCAEVLRNLAALSVYPALYIGWYWLIARHVVTLPEADS